MEKPTRIAIEQQKLFEYVSTYRVDPKTIPANLIAWNIGDTVTCWGTINKVTGISFLSDIQKYENDNRKTKNYIKPKLTVYGLSIGDYFYHMEYIKPANLY